MDSFRSARLQEAVSTGRRPLSHPLAALSQHRLPERAVLPAPRPRQLARGKGGRADVAARSVGMLVCPLCTLLLSRVTLCLT